MKILLLIHPDAIFEKTQDADKIRDYLGELNFAISYTTKTYTLFMYSDVYVPSHNQELYRLFRQFLSKNSLASFDKMTMGRNLFMNDLADVIIDNPDATIVYGGGYTQHCVKDTMKNFHKILGDIHHGDVVPMASIMFAWGT